MTKNIYQNKFFSWSSIIAFAIVLLNTWVFKDILLSTISIIFLIIAVVQDIKGYVVKQLAEHDTAKESLGEKHNE